MRRIVRGLRHFSPNALKSKQELAAGLKKIGIKQEYQETEGSHRWSVWRGYLAEFLPRLFR